MHAALTLRAVTDHCSVGSGCEASVVGRVGWLRPRDHLANVEFIGVHDLKNMFEQLRAGAQSGNARVTECLLDCLRRGSRDLLADGHVLPVAVSLRETTGEHELGTWKAGQSAVWSSLDRLLLAPLLNQGVICVESLFEDFQHFCILELVVGSAIGLLASAVAEGQVAEVKRDCRWLLLVHLVSGIDCGPGARVCCSCFSGKEKRKKNTQCRESTNMADPGSYRVSSLPWRPFRPSQP